jgi:hypothetical protein
LRHKLGWAWKSRARRAVARLSCYAAAMTVDGALAKLRAAKPLQDRYEVSKV